MTLDKFLTTYKVGKSYDYANTGYKGECVSLVKATSKTFLVWYHRYRQCERLLA